MLKSKSKMKDDENEDDIKEESQNEKKSTASKLCN